MLRKKCLGEIHQISDGCIGRIRPPARKFKTIARALTLFYCTFASFFYMCRTRRVAVVLGVRAVRNHKKLHIFKKPGCCPKTLSVIAVYLVKCLLNCYTSSFQLQMHHRQAVYQDRDIVSIRALSFVCRILVYHL